ncbi:MAG: transcription antitermination factor NusB, partial [Acidobacteriota bacterium]
MTVTIHAIMDVPVPSPARRAAFLVLSQVARKEGEPVGLLHGPATRGLSRADLRLTTELVYGVLRWQATLDYVLEVHARRPVERMDLPALLSLRIGLYQIRHLSGVPERAAVDEAVKLTRAYRHRGATGFVNAVLRSVCRRPEFPPLPSKDDDPLSYLAITLSHPRWLARRWLQRLGTEAAARRCRSDNQSPPTDLRIEPPLSAEEASLELAAEGIRGAPFAAVPGCVRVHSGSLSESSL